MYLTSKNTVFPVTGGHSKCNEATSSGQGSHRLALLWDHNLTLDSSLLLAQVHLASPQRCQTLVHPALQAFGGWWGGTVFTRMLVSMNWSITALTKFFICLKSFWSMLPEPSIRKAMSISCLGHSAGRKRSEMHVWFQPPPGAQKPFLLHSQGAIRGIGLEPHPVSGTFH